MHACLNVDEIVRLIACELVGSGGGKSAVALACCCRSFEDPGLDGLWVTQHSLHTLLKTFPEDVWDEGKLTTFKRLPTKMEWARFHRYARRMRDLKNLGTLDSLPLEVLSVVQARNVNEPLLPNLKTLNLWEIPGSFTSFIPSLLPLGLTSLTLEFGSGHSKAVVASMVSTFPRLCPNLQAINLYSLPADPMITVAVSEMLLATNLNTLQTFHVDSPLTEEASEVLYKLSDLHDLLVVVDGSGSSHALVLPNLTALAIICDDEDDLTRLFQGAKLGRLESVDFSPRSEQVGDFLGAFEKVALSSSIQKTLSRFELHTPYPWNPTYSSLLPFTQLVDLDIEFSCDYGCSSRVDDDIITNLSQAMPKLWALKLGDRPCQEFTTGVTMKGLMALALHCPKLSYLRIHLQVASLTSPPESPEITPNSGTIASWTDCALTDLEVGEILVPKESVSIVALTLLRVSPRIDYISSVDEGWEKVEDTIRLSRQTVDRSCVTLETGS